MDSFVGSIKTGRAKLYFDFSRMGYANSLLRTEEEYLKSSEWLRESPFYKSGVTYTADFNVKTEKARQMKEKGTTDSTLVRVEADPDKETKKYVHKPTAEQLKKFPNADYVADLTYRDSTVNVPIQIPADIKSHHIKIDTNSLFIIKTIWPKVPSKGLIGVYIKSRKTSLNFQLSGTNLSASEQGLALKAFKTIRIAER